MKAKELKAMALKANSEQAQIQKTKKWINEELYPFLERLAEKGETEVFISMQLRETREVKVDYVINVLEENGFEICYKNDWLWIKWG